MKRMMIWIWGASFGASLVLTIVVNLSFIAPVIVTGVMAVVYVLGYILDHWDDV